MIYCFSSLSILLLPLWGVFAHIHSLIQNCENFSLFFFFNFAPLPVFLLHSAEIKAVDGNENEMKVERRKNFAVQTQTHISPSSFSAFYIFSLFLDEIRVLGRFYVVSNNTHSRSLRRKSRVSCSWIHTLRCCYLLKAFHLLRVHHPPCSHSSMMMSCSVINFKAINHFKSLFFFLFVVRWRRFSCERGNWLNFLWKIFSRLKIFLQVFNHVEIFLNLFNDELYELCQHGNVGESVNVFLWVSRSLIE